MNFITQYNSQNNKQKVVFNLSMIACIKDNDKCFIVEYLGNDCYIQKDENSQKLFDYFCAKIEKDILGVQNLDKIQTTATDLMNRLANLNILKKE